MKRNLPTGPVYRAANAVEVGEQRTIKFVASDENVDRYGDIVRASGWDLANFKANPVLLFGHQSRDLPIGRVSSIEVIGKQLVAVAEFMSAELNAKADAVYRMVKEGFLNAVSVGFKPTKKPNQIKHPDTNEWTGGYEFIAQELMELSVVPVPALPSALALSRSYGSVEEYFRQFQELESDDGASAARLALRRREIEILRLLNAA
jgi:HK97 family phage prohead protease